MREKPTLILLHGGPGFDHSLYKPAFGRLADIAQVVYLDHLGNGRSALGDPSGWILAQWADDVKGLCDALGIWQPIVLGTSFGGFVAQAYAARHPGHSAGLILVSTAAKVDFLAVFDAFERFGGPEARQAAEAYWTNPGPRTGADYARICLPLYLARRQSDAAVMQRVVMRHEVAVHFNGPEKEHGRLDFRTALGSVKCPVLVIAGELDPITPIVFSQELARCLPPHLLRFERFQNCSHVVQGDDPERFFALVREFIRTAASRHMA